ncbi:MAG: beta-propeller fold lactonase family protein [Rhizobacter sp.]|nr:beta-propeller fold lactonase family protein [Rhizobacter sp.]
MTSLHLRATRRLALAVAVLGLPAAATAADAGRAYVSNQGAGVAVIDLDTLRIVDTIDAQGEEPRGLGLTADGRWLVVATRKNGDIAVLDRSTGKLARRIRIGKNPEFVRVRGNMAFVSYEPSSEGGPPPKAGAAERKDDDDNDPAHIAVVDIARGKVVRSLQAGLETEGIEFSADGKRLLLANERDNTISVHDIATGKVVQVVDLKPYGERPRGIKRTPDGEHYVATLEFANAFVVLNASYEVEKTVKTGQSPYGVAFDRDGKRLFVAAAKSKLLQVFDARTWAPIQEAPIGERCWHFTFTPDGARLLVACGRSNEVIALDANTLQVVQRIPVQSLPWGVVTYPKAAGSLDWPE